VRLSEPKLALFDLTMAIHPDGGAERQGRPHARWLRRRARGQCFRQIGELEDSLCDFKRAKHYQPEKNVCSNGFQAVLVRAHASLSFPATNEIFSKKSRLLFFLEKISFVASPKATKSSPKRFRCF
jgi:hypothetical protein